MRIAVIGGTKFVGPAAVRRLAAAGHEVAVAHTGAHEHPAVESAAHLHGDRDALLSPGGLVDGWRPEALVDTFPGGATAAKGEQIATCAARTGARVVAISSVDVYQHGVDSGMGDGGGLVAMSIDPIPLREDARRGSAPIRARARDTTTWRWRTPSGGRAARRSCCGRAPSTPPIPRPASGRWCAGSRSATATCRSPTAGSSSSTESRSIASPARS